jgi:hypothetical protein
LAQVAQVLQVQMQEWLEVIQYSLPLHRLVVVVALKQMERLVLVVLVAVEDGVKHHLPLAVLEHLDKETMVAQEG